MIEYSVFTSAFLVAAAWQTTLALGLGGLLYLVWRRHSGRAHFCLTLGLIASLALPLAAMAVRHAGWGLLPTVSVSSEEKVHAHAAEPVAQAALASSPTAKAISRSVFPWIGALWLGGSALLGLRLIVGFGLGVRLLAAARPLVNERLNASLESAMALLDVRRTPITFTTDAVRCPAIWCWAIHPALLLPSSIVAASAHWTERQWLSVFSHELAHLRRRDHFAAIVAEAICALFWWQPLAWWSRARLNELSDEACDRWVVASGQAPDVYAETLIDMVPQRRSLAALSMVTTRRGLTRRVAAILEAAPIPPTPGRRWVVGNTIAALCLVLVIACMQTPTQSKAPANNATGTLAVANPSMEAGDAEPASWTRGTVVDGVEYVWDRAVAKTGRGSLCLRKTAQRYFPIAQWTQTISVPAADRPRKFRLSAWVKADQAYKAILDLQYAGTQDDWKHKWAAYIGGKANGAPPANHDWQLYSGEVEVPAGITMLTIGLQIYGPGTVWFDDVELVPVDAS